MRKLAALLLWASLLGSEAGAQNFAAPVFELEPKATLPHHPEHFTQGLFFHQGALYESTGLYGQSRLVRLDPHSGAILAEFRLDGRYFGEGAAAAGADIFWLTWRERTAFILGDETLQEKGRFAYSGEGWGLTFDGNRLIRSSGADYLQFHDLSGQPLGLLPVRDGDNPVSGLNELEWIPANGVVLANVWPTAHIAVINIRNGAVLAWLDGQNLAPDRDLYPRADVLNGLALSPDGQELWLTGKCWPQLYIIAWPPAGLENLLP